MDEMWGCSQCRSINPAFVSSCYKCHSVRGAAPMVVPGGVEVLIADANQVADSTSRAAADEHEPWQTVALHPLAARWSVPSPYTVHVMGRATRGSTVQQ